jgi:YfiH family protein
MAGWKRRAIGDLPLYQATTLSWLPNLVQGFTTRNGGVSAAPYDTLNLGAHVGDTAETVRVNRERVCMDLGFTSSQLALAEQIHGDGVGQVTEPTAAPLPGIDALMTDVPNVMLLMLYADCAPIYLFDPLRRAIGLVHAGWRGTAANIVAKTVKAMQQTYDINPRQCIAAIGPCIGGDSYEVGTEVADQFRNFAGGHNAGASTAVFPKDEMTGTYLVNLRQILYMQLLAAGLTAEAIAVCDEDTFRNRRDFFSYRREGSKTGRMAAFMALQEKIR